MLAVVSGGGADVTRSTYLNGYCEEQIVLEWVREGLCRR